MLTNASITVFNKFPDQKSRKFIYVPHYIEHVWFYKDQKVSVASGGMTSADAVKVRIPVSECENWVDETAFVDLIEPGESWTVQDKDFFILGEWTGGPVSDLTELKNGYPGEVWTILSHSENFFGSSKHIRIGGGV